MKKFIARLMIISMLVCFFGCGGNAAAPVATESTGDESAVFMAGYEMFDTNGMFIKENSPFEKTFIIGYAHPVFGGTFQQLPALQTAVTKWITALLHPAPVKSLLPRL